MSGRSFRRNLLPAVSAAALACLAPLASAPAFAQGTGPGAAGQAATQNAVQAPEVPKELLAQMIAGDANALKAIRTYLMGADTDRKPQAIARRATELIRALGKSGGGANADILLKVVDRVASTAINMVAGAQVIRIGIDKNYTPRNAVLAMSFGTPDSKTPEGFQRVLPGDPRIAGQKLSALRRPSDSEVLNGGISGIERIETDMPNGEYRVILMTQNLGDKKLMGNPFGSEVVVNGSALPVSQPDPGDWVSDAVLTNRGAGALRASGGDSGGFISGTLSEADTRASQTQQGGAIIIPATVRNGKLIIEMRGLGSSRTYLSGMLVEPQKNTSDLVMSPQARDTVVPPELRLGLEENILTAAANVLSSLQPAAGDPELVDLPEPILDPQENASTSS